MIKTKVEFQNTQGEKLAGLLEIPENPVAYALFAHCFTCGKDIKSASRISRALGEKSIAVLRFDFTGLGGSDGDFSNSNFSSNVEDLLAAADFLRVNYEAPKLLIGHSLGGAAVLAAASGIPQALAVATIGTPADVTHVVKNFHADLDSILKHGQSPVILAGREFTIKRQFLEDIQRQNQNDKISRLGKSLLIFHSPVDTTVAIDQAQKIFQAAKHPKSFISLDTADHLLSNSRDAEYVATCIASWFSRYI
ncbi:alpha/beta hydrolase [Pseudomonas atacamensis]|uniref:Alpha/beta hydrolase n=1 Tax=Pseudomonas atacamensis TaxID=2565368 RepID=A0AAQ2HYH8_9PSED|nr:alpha/beta hydrolase [Pseudomonas atacamensis]THF25794.1 alpha/beta hydrolase [Pseudomonas atacamensis]